jgi:hypothetical protein
MTLSQVPRELAERLVPHPQTCTEQYCTCTGWLIENRFRVEAVIREAMQKAQPQWISVEEKLPEEWRYVLICRWDGAPRNDVGFIVWVGRYFGNTGWQSDDGVEIQCPTHWMPLPEPPNPAASSLTEQETTK